MEKHHKQKDEHETTTGSLYAEETILEKVAAEQAEAEAEVKLNPNFEQQLLDTKDQLLRAIAETENVRKRAERERLEIAQYGITNFARDLLTVADNLGRAIESMEKNEGNDIQAMIEGVKITEKDLYKVFEKHKIKKIEPLGEAFDHNFHQAMFEVESEEQPAGTVVQVLQAGYVLGDRLLRPAMVGVAKVPASKME